MEKLVLWGNAVIHPRFFISLPLVELYMEYDCFHRLSPMIYDHINVDMDWMQDPIECCLEEVITDDLISWYYVTFEFEKPDMFGNGDYDTIVTLHNISTLKFSENYNDG